MVDDAAARTVLGFKPKFTIDDIVEELATRALT
jgi:nucleoside-diphosphate-sugar epimerase